MAAMTRMATAPNAGKIRAQRTPLAQQAKLNGGLKSRLAFPKKAQLDKHSCHK